MSWSLSVVGTDGADAKAKLAEANERQQAGMPEGVQKLAEAAVDLLPPSGIDGYDAVAVSTYGHLHGEGVGTSNVNLSVQHVNSDGLNKVAA